jgi:putative transcriptional regulator
MILHTRLKEIRLQRSLTQEALARAAGVTRQTIISIEKQKFVPSVKLAMQLAAVLDSPVDRVFWLESGQGGKS